MMADRIQEFWQLCKRIHLSESPFSVTFCNLNFPFKCILLGWRNFGQQTFQLYAAVELKGCFHAGAKNSFRLREIILFELNIKIFTFRSRLDPKNQMDIFSDTKINRFVADCCETKIFLIFLHRHYLRCKLNMRAFKCDILLHFATLINKEGNIMSKFMVCFV